MKKTVITIIRIAIGWHFLYEGCVKLFSDNWTSASYLVNTRGFLSGFYHWLAASPARLWLVDFLNIWGLILIGVALFAGLFARWASLAGALLLLLYYFAYPPFGYTMFEGMGSVYIVNQQLIEATMLVFLFCFNIKGYGLDNVIGWLRKKRPTAPDSAVPASDADGSVNSRRAALKELISLPVLGLFGWGAARRDKIYGIDTLSGATVQVNRVALGELKGELPKGKIGNQVLTRLVMGDNHIGAVAHARDLMYVGSLMRAYNTEKKIFETLMICEQAGINCINIGFPNLEMLVKYRKVTGSKMKIISQVGIRDQKNEDIFEDIKVCIDNGIDMIQIQGSWGDWLSRDGRFDVIDGMLNLIRRNGIVAGLGAHAIDTLILCEEQGIIPDYYMKTMHNDQYWSAHPRANRKPFEVVGYGTPGVYIDYLNNDRDYFRDNCWDTYPDRTVEFVNRVKVPVMGFKVLAAGAIHPKDAFKWAFENGADFICVGMFDFQVVNDVNICLDTLQNLQHRKRAWYS